MPSVLVEAGYLTNATEEAFLATDEGREQMALGIFKAVRAYKDHMEGGKSSMIVKTPAKPKTNTAPPATQASVKAPVTAKKETTPVKIFNQTHKMGLTQPLYLD